MSYQIKLQNLSIDERQKIMKDLIFEQTVNDNKIKKIYSYKIDEDSKYVILPFNYTGINFSNHPLKKIFEIQQSFPKFLGKLYDEQIISRNECIDQLNLEKSCILSLPVGCGKCLHPDTRLIMFDGSIKMAKEIQINDLLMGDDSTPRIVKSVTSDQDKLYTIRNDDFHVNYTVNSHHILTLYNMLTNTIEDVQLSEVFHKIPIYRGIRTSVAHLKGKNIADRYKEINSYFKNVSTYTTIDENIKNNLVFLIRSVGLSVKIAYKKNMWIITKLRSTQDVLYPFIIEYHSTGKYCGFELSGNGRFLLDDFTITHNTATSINIATKIKLKTLIILNRLLLIDQWETSILKFCPDAKIYIIKPKAAVIPLDYDFYIINAINVPKFEREKYTFIGLCIVDECHMIMSEVLSQCMWKIEPKYLLGLSATPYRFDGLNAMIKAYFGEYKIMQEINREFTVYKVNTNLTIDYTYNRFGKLDWTSLITTQSLHQERNQMIIDIVKKYKDRCFLLLTKRVEQGKILSKMLKDENIDHDCLFGLNKYIETKKKVLIGTTQKVGVGFDAAKLNTLVICNDIVNYYIQYIGRVMRSKDCDAWVFDLVDENSILKKHFAGRCKVYKEHGGNFEQFNF